MTPLICLFFTVIFVHVAVLSSLKPLAAEKNWCPKIDVPNCRYWNYGDGEVDVQCTGIKDDNTLRQILEEIQNVPRISLDLRDLQLPYLPRGLFKNVNIARLVICDSPTMISLAPNSTYGDSVFEGLEEHLEKLIISNNTQMTSLQLRELHILRNLTNLRISQVPVDMSRSMSWIKRLPLQRIMIKETNTMDELSRKAFFLMRKLSSVELAKNKNLKKISRDLFPNPAEHLHFIALRDNSIEEIPSDIFDGMPKLEFVDFRGNRIVYFYESTFLPVWSQLKRFFIHENPIHCDENIIWLIKEMKSSSELCVYEGHYTCNLGTCASPKKLRDRRIKSLQESELETSNNL